MKLSCENKIKKERDFHKFASGSEPDLVFTECLYLLIYRSCYQKQKNAVRFHF